MVDEMGFEPPTSSLRTVGKISSGKAPQPLSYFHEALNWQTWQTGFLFVFSMQFDGPTPFAVPSGSCLDEIGVSLPIRQHFLQPTSGQRRETALASIGRRR